MKKLIKLLSITLSFMLVQQAMFAQNENKNDQKKYEFQRHQYINKSYNVSSSDKLNIQNTFGDVHVHTWTKSEIKVDVTIEVSANTEALAQKMMDGIHVDENKGGNEITFKTSIKGINNTKGEKSTMKINYEVSMPATNPLRISNEFGAVEVPDYKGEVEFSSKFGSLNTGTLTNVKSINVEFGSAKIEGLTDGPVSIKYSSADLGKLSGKVKLDLSFSDATKIDLDNSLTSLNVNVSYSSLNLKPVGDLQAAYNISTSFGGFKNRTNVKFDSDENGEDKGPKFDFNYNGKSGNGSIPVIIKSSFGDIILGEPRPEDLKDKRKHKAKTSTV